MDRLPGHPILALAAAGAAAALALVPFSSSLAPLLAVVLLMGFAVALMDVGSNTLLTWLFRGGVGPYMVGLHFSFALGAFLGPAAVAQATLLKGSYAWAFWGLALLLLPLALLLLRLPSPRPRVPSKRGREKALDWGLALPLIGVLFCYSGSEAGFGAWAYSYALKLQICDATQAAYLVSLFWGLLGLGRLLGIPLSAKLLPERLLAWLLPLSLPPLLLLLFGPQNLLALRLAACGLGLMLACIFPTMIVYLGQRLGVGGHVSGRLTSYFFVGASSGCIVLPWIMGQIIEPLGPKAAMGVPLLAQALMSLLFFSVLRRGPKPMVSRAARRA